MRFARFIRLFIVMVSLASPVAAQPSARVHHTVEVRDPATRVFYVTSRYTRLAQRSLDLSLPVWTPGWYTVENYARNILRLEFTDGSGRRRPSQLMAKSTWRVDTEGATELEARFEYIAPALGLNQATIANEWAFFTGTQLFLEPIGHRNWGASVRFALPAGWRVLSSLRDTPDPMQFTANDYDELADATTQLGHFDAKRFDVDGTPHWFIATPAGALSSAQLDTMADHAARIAGVQVSVFGDRQLPYSKYLYHYFFLPSETNTGGGLEHANSHVSIVGALDGASPTTHDGLVAHELFHVWNGKRLRPVELWPYDYSREMYTPNLWVSEGFTNYYASLSLLRAGLEGRDAFLAHVTNAISSIETADARQYVSIEDASTSTWLSYGASQTFGISYYAGGEVIATVLDLMILHTSGGAAGLDDLMRTLWRETAVQGRGFNRTDFERALAKTAGRDLAPVLRRMVDEPAVPPYDSVLAFAGYQLERIDRQLPVLGMVRRTAAQGDEILRITPGGSADRAGLQVGDVVQTVDDQPVAGVRFADLIGRNVRFTILRHGERETVSVRVIGRAAPIFRIVELERVTPTQRALRERWLGS